jgi:DNA-binding Lrp family transcriptional regulator
LSLLQDSCSQHQYKVAKNGRAPVRTVPSGALPPDEQLYQGGLLTMTELKMKILELLKEDARRSAELIATMLDAPAAEVKQAIAEMEQDHVIVKYATVTNWSKVDEEKVTALIEVQITPERGRGFEGIAERIYLYPEVKSVYLMSGAYDLLVEVQGKTLKDVASFVSNKLSPIDAVLSTKTFFILKKYKQDGIIFEEHEDDHRLPVSP